MQEVVLVQNEAFQFQLSGIEAVKVSYNNFNLEKVGLIHKSSLYLTRQGSSEASASSLPAEAAWGDQHNQSHSVFVQPGPEFHILPQETLWKYKAN